MQLATKMRNRLIGLLIIVSFVLILFPLMMSEDKDQQNRKDLIAVNSDGALTNEQGQLVEPQERDYATLLAPENDGNSGQINIQNNNLYNDDQTSTTANNTAPRPMQLENSYDAPRVEVNNNLMTTPQTVELSPAPTPAPVQTVVPTTPAPSQSVANTSKPQSQAVTDSKPAPVTTSSSGIYTIQVGAFSVVENANKIIAQLRLEGINANLKKDTVNGKTIYRVQAGSANNKDDLNALVTRIKNITTLQGKIVKR